MKSAPATWRKPALRLSLLLIFATLLSFAPSCFAQDGDQSSPTTRSHPSVFGVWGGSPALETKVYDLRIPLSFTVIRPDDGRWGLRIRLVTYAGLYDFTLDEAIGLDLRFQSLAVTPGVEFLAPVGGAWVLKPFAEIGYGRDFDNQLGFGVWSMGIRTLATWQVKKFDLSFGTKFQYLSTFTNDLELSDRFGEIRLGFDARHPLPFTIGGSQADLSAFFIRRQYIDAFIGREEINPLEINFNNEIGFTFGTTPKVKLWFVQLPRIGLGYRWGPNVRGIRLNFGFPF
ncbi:MAG: hypothetical protein P8127_08290 [Acidobacteriota bacterium]|jgi:hypothetical protein